MDFTVFYTFVKDAGVRVPVTIGYDAPRSMIAALAAHDMPQFIHSGNWWNIAPEKRTKDIVLAKQATFVNSCTIGIMSTNVQPGNDPLYWVTGASTSTGGCTGCHFIQSPSKENVVNTTCSGLSPTLV